MIPRPWEICEFRGQYTYLNASLIGSQHRYTVPLFARDLRDGIERFQAQALPGNADGRPQTDPGQ